MTLDDFYKILTLLEDLFDTRNYWKRKVWENSSLNPSIYKTIPQTPQKRISNHQNNQTSNVIFGENLHEIKLIFHIFISLLFHFLLPLDYLLPAKKIIILLLSLISFFSSCFCFFLYQIVIIPKEGLQYSRW